MSFEMCAWQKTFKNNHRDYVQSKLIYQGGRPNKKFSLTAARLGAVVASKPNIGIAPGIAP